MRPQLLLDRLCAASSNQKGAVSIIVALAMIMVIGCAALAVDVGSVFLQSRKLQGVADLAALSAARDLKNATAAAQATVAANQWESPPQVQVVMGRYASDGKLAAPARFTAGAAAPNAVQVELRGKAKLFFGEAIIGKPDVNIVRRATAARAELASFSIGTRLASLQGGVANQLLSGLTGSTVSLTVMDYNLLARADVDLFSYVEALRTTAGLKGASFDNVLSADVSRGTALRALSAVLHDGGDSVAAAAIDKVAAAAGMATPAHLNRVLNLGPYAAQDHIAGGKGADIRVGALALAEAILSSANGGRLLKLDLGASVPGIADADIWLAIGERPNQSPWLGLDDDGDVTVRTAQMRLYVVAKGLGALGVLGMQPVELPLLVEAASGEAKLSAIDCPADAASQAVTLAVRPSIGQAAIGEIDTSKLNDFKHTLVVKPATFVDLLLAKVSGSVQVQLGGQNWQQVRFPRADVSAGVVKMVKTDDILEATAGSLLQRLNLQVNLLALGLNAGTLTQGVSNTLSGLAAPLDGLVNSLTDLLGVGLGEADVRVNGLRCRDAALVA